MLKIMSKMGIAVASLGNALFGPGLERVGERDVHLCPKRTIRICAKIGKSLH
nr:hypothetical protein [Sphingomonas sp. YR710]